MTIDERGRQAGVSLRGRAAQIDVDSSLDAMAASVRRRRYVRATAVVAAAAAVVVIGGLALQGTEQRADVPPTTHSSDTEPDQCDLAFLVCETRSRFSVNMPTPLTWTVPNTFNQQLHYTTSGQGGDQAVMIESYRDGRITADVTLAENVFAARIVRHPPADPMVASDRRLPAGAHAVARWLSQRPYLVTSDVTPTTVDGRQAWTVQVRLRDPDRPGLPSCVNFRCTPILVISDELTPHVLGVWDRMVSRYTFVDLPTAGTAAIWSWSFNGVEPLTGNRALVDALEFHSD